MNEFEKKSLEFHVDEFKVSIIPTFGEVKFVKYLNYLTTTVFVNNWGTFYLFIAKFFVP